MQSNIQICQYKLDKSRELKNLSNKSCSFEINNQNTKKCIHLKNIKQKKGFSTLKMNVYQAPNQHMRFISEGS